MSDLPERRTVLDTQTGGVAYASGYVYALEERLAEADAHIAALQSRLYEARAAEDRVRELEAEVAQLGVMGDVCTYHTLKKVCEFCRCKRATASAGAVQERSTKETHDET